jgi:hypothetical protein
MIKNNCFFLEKIIYFASFKGENVGCFTQNIGIANALHLELMRVILAIEFACDNCDMQ